MRRSSCHLSRLPWIRVLLACAAAVWVCGCSREQGESSAGWFGTGSPAPRPPIVLIVADSLRADRLGAYGSDAGHTPTLDDIAREGVVVERAIAPAPWSQPAVASLFTGVYPSVHGVTSYEAAFDGAVVGNPPARVLGARFETLAQALQRAGYETAGFVATPFLAAPFGFDRGFDHYEHPPAGHNERGDELSAGALAWLDAREERRPLFLYLHYMDAHGPYEASPERLDPLLDEVEALANPRQLSAEERERLDYLERLPRDAVDPARHARLSDTLEYWQARYDAAVRELDAHIQSLRAALSERGIWQQALVVVLADHGEALLDGGLWDHGGSLQDAELRVPLMWRWPGHLPAGERVETTASLVDVLPTLVDLLRLDTVPHVQGRSLAGALRGAPPGAPVTVFAEAVKRGPDQKAIYRGRYELVRVQTASGARDRLIDLESEARPEARDGSRPDLQSTLARALDAQLRANRARASGAGDVAAPPRRDP